MKTANKHTPWGFSQQADEVAPGITWFSTSGHGGISLSSARIAEMPTNLRSIHPWAGPGWYEEDCDWAIVCAAFPQYFNYADCYYASRTLPHISYGKTAVSEFLKTDEGQHFTRRASYGQPQTKTINEDQCAEACGL